jgi:hypothetical protein
MNGNGHAPGLIVIENGRPRPKIGEEKGSTFDYVGGDSLFTIPGESRDEGLLYDYRTPNVPQLKEMLDHDGRARSLEQCLVMPIAGAEWTLSGADQGVIDRIDDELRRATLEGGMETPMSDVISQKAEAFVFRASFHEKVWKVTDDNRVTYKKIAWRPPESCTIRREKKSGELRGFAQQIVGEVQQVLIDLPYADVYVHGARRDPNRGVSDLTVTYHNYRIKEKIKYLWYTYCEVLSLPRQIILATGETEGKKAATAIAGLRNAGVAGIPASWVKEIRTLETAGAGSTDFQDVLSYLDSDSALSLLAGFSELPARAMGSGSSHGPLGSYALAESSQNFFVDLLGSYAKEMDAQVTNSIIADLVRYNEGIKVQIPQFHLDLDKQAVSTALELVGRLLTSPVPTNVPFEFVKELVLTVAKTLGMDVDGVRKAIDLQQKALTQAANTAQAAQAAPLAAATNVGTAVATQAQREMNS